jgi:hypothetical protein
MPRSRPSSARARAARSDRAFIAETAYAVLRRKRLLERLAACGPNLEAAFLARAQHARSARPGQPRREAHLAA